jgi:hypothetical protein
MLIWSVTTIAPWAQLVRALSANPSLIGKVRFARRTGASPACAGMTNTLAFVGTDVHGTSPVAVLNFLLQIAVLIYCWEH